MKPNPVTAQQVRSSCPDWCNGTHFTRKHQAGDHVDSVSAIDWIKSPETQSHKMSLWMWTSLQCLRGRNDLFNSERAAEYISANGCYTFQKNADENETGCHFPWVYSDVFQLSGNACFIYQVLSYVTILGKVWVKGETQGKLYSFIIFSFWSLTSWCDWQLMTALTAGEGFRKTFAIE